MENMGKHIISLLKEYVVFKYQIVKLKILLFVFAIKCIFRKATLCFLGYPMCILPPIMFCLYVAWKICLLVQGGCHPCTGFVHHLVMCRAIWVIDRNAAALEECRCCSLLASVAPQARTGSGTRAAHVACGRKMLI